MRVVHTLARAVGRALYATPLGLLVAAWILVDAGHRHAAAALLLVALGWNGHALWADFRTFRASYLGRRRAG